MSEQHAPESEQSVPKKSPKKIKKAKSKFAPKHGPAEMVPATFLKKLPKRLGIKVEPLCKLLGIKSSAYYYYTAHNRCPVAVRAAANGLVAEKHVIETEGTVPTVVKRGRQAVPMIQAPQEDMQVLMVAVPNGQSAVARALMAACGYPVKAAGS